MIRNFAYIVVAVLLVGGQAGWSQVINVDMNNAAAWTVVQDLDAAAEFGFDYSIYGIPPAPHGTDSLGVRLAANLAEPAESAAITISPNGVSPTGRYRVEVDAWLNFFGDPDGNGTTEFAGVLVGFNPSGEPINGAGLIGSTDGDAAEDYRLYVDDTQLTLDSAQYFVPSLNDIDPVFVDHFPSEDVPSEQLENFDPPNLEPLPRDGRLAFAWRRFSVEVDGELAVFSIDDLEIGYVDSQLNGIDLSGPVGLTLWDIFSSVAPEPEFAFTIYDNLSIEPFDGNGTPGDFNLNGVLDGPDIDDLTARSASGTHPPDYDLNADTLVNEADIQVWVKDLFKSWIGDADLNHEFSSTDLVTVLASGTYEADVDAVWTTGDFTGDARTNSSDLVAALADGGYEQGPAAVAVPEPATWVLLSAGLLLCRRRRVR